MNYKFGELFGFRISIKSYENMNKVGPTHLFQVASCFPVFPTFCNVASALESDFTAQMVWCGSLLRSCALRWDMPAYFLTNHYFSQTYCSARYRLPRLIREIQKDYIKYDLTCLQKDRENLPQGRVVDENVV